MPANESSPPTAWPACRRSPSQITSPSSSNLTKNVKSANLLGRKAHLWLYFSRRHVRESPAESTRAAASRSADLYLALRSRLGALASCCQALGISQLAA